MGKRLVFLILIAFYNLSSAQTISVSTGYGKESGILGVFKQYYYLYDNDRVVPRNQFSIFVQYQQPLSRQYNISLNTGLDLSRTGFYYSIRGNRDWSNYLYENVNLSLMDLRLNAGLTKGFKFYDENLTLNIGFNAVLMLPVKSRSYKSSRPVPDKSYFGMYYMYESIYENRYYDYLILLEKQQFLNFGFELNIDLLFKINENLSLIVGFRNPLFFDQRVNIYPDIMYRTSKPTFAQSFPDGNLIPVNNYLITHPYDFDEFRFTEFKLGFAYTLKNKKN